MQPGSLLVARLATIISLAAADLGRGRLGRLSVHRHLGGDGELADDLLRGTLDGSMVPVDHRLDRLAEIAQQVPAIRDLNSIGCALPNAVSISTGTIPGDDRDAGVLAQPGGQGL